jgi:nucleoside-diphosphate-sugar epimerase
MAVAVFGASGLVGFAVVRRLIADGRYQVRPFIHTPGNAWRLARLGLPMEAVDLRSPSGLRAAVDGVTHVVNCTRGMDRATTRGLGDLLRACRDAGVGRFVHLSSVLVYGEPPPPESVTEAARPKVTPGSPAAFKLRHDEMVRAACARGLPSVVLCPPNISGPHSPFLLQVVEAMRRGTFALVEGGAGPCNLVDVENLAHAVTRALECERADGTRTFVTDGGDATWRDVAEALAPLAGSRGPFPSLSRAEAAKRTRGSGGWIALLGRDTLGRTARFLVSSEVRDVLRRDPAFETAEAAARRLAARLPGGLADRLKSSVSSSRMAGLGDGRPAYSAHLLRQQLRTVRHSCGKAARELGYAPPHTFAESMAAFRAWYTAHHDYDEEFMPLARALRDT